MPVVALSYRRLCRLAGAPRGRVAQALPFLGLDIESEDGDEVRVEYSPNRPDYSTEFGIAAGLQGLLGLRTGAIRPRLRPGAGELRADASVARLRPRITAVAATGGRLDDRSIRQLMGMQEDLHSGIGRGRKKASIGIHDLSRVAFPLEYTAVRRDHRFVPLGSEEEMAVSGVLQGTEQGRAYGGLLRPGRVPALLGADGQTISLPPVINAAQTALNPRTRGVLVEVTGTDGRAVGDVLSVASYTLQLAGFALESVRVTGAGNRTPRLGMRRVRLPRTLADSVLGLGLGPQETVRSLRRSRLDAAVRGGGIECTVPPHRFDIFGPADLVEEVALGHGIEKLEPELPPPQGAGSASRRSLVLAAAGRAMVGLGYMEAFNPVLADPGVLYGTAGRDAAGALRVADSKSSGHTVLRDMLLPGLAANLAGNVHEPYPQRLFEHGPVFAGGTEGTALAAVSAHRGASFTEAKSVLLPALREGLGIEASVRAADHPMLAPGRSGDVVAGGTRIGVIGELHPDAASRHRIRVPVAGFEVLVPASALSAQD